MQMGSITLNGNSSGDIFLAKMDLNGNFIWAKKAGSVSEEDEARVFVEPDGDVVLAGKAGASAIFDTIQISAGGFIARYNSNGNCKWAKQCFSGPEKYPGVVIDFIGSDIVMTGLFNQNPSYIDTATLIPMNNYLDGFICRLDSIGSLKWLLPVRNKSSNGFGSISIDSSNNIYVGGFFKDSLIVGVDTFYNVNRSAILMKIRENGQIAWTKYGPNTDPTFGGVTAIALNNNGRIYITGHFSGNITFDSLNISSNNTFDMFLTELDTSGKYISVLNFGKASGTGVVVDNNGKIVLSGNFYSAVTIGNNSFNPRGPGDLYLTKLSDFLTSDTNKRLSQTSKNELQIYANPTTGKCNITIPEELMNEKSLTLFIYDNVGKLIQSVPVNISEENILINLESEPKGIYNAVIGNSKLKFSGKIAFQ